MIHSKSANLRKYGPSALSLAAILFLFPLVPLYDNAYAHGDAPTTCGDNMYDAVITSLTIDNGVETFDPITNHGLHFDAYMDTGYRVTFTLHTYPESRNGNTDPGSTWYRHEAYGFGWGQCVDEQPVGADQDITIDGQIPASGVVTDGHTQTNVQWGTWVEFNTAQYNVTWHEGAPPPTDAPEAESELTVRTEDGHTGSEISGYWTVLSKDGSTVATGFSPAIFTLDNDENYVVSVADYGEYVFDHWEDTGSTIRDRSISISSDTSTTAIYRNVNSPPLEQPPDEETPPEEEEPPAQPGEDSTVTIRSIDRNSGNEISGYYTILYDGNGAVLDTRFSPATFDVTSGQEYSVEVQDYGSYYFNYWQDNGDTDRDRALTGTDDAITLTAVYSTSPSATPPADDTPEEEEQTAGEISVITVDSSGNQIFGYHTTLSQNGNVIQTAFSPVEFAVDGGQTYQVAVADYGSYAFDHWNDGSTDTFHDAQAGDSLTAMYRP